mmetsp:Transcript_17192/g.26566  ORF Transcript_17192/g.26566 Transcript_17192/m.26566 type:complete len:116 (+) Transcript_17192:152-499(+)|eukprot:CAMPEP_0170512620 /NCGR_PEP_ID=MMETSP0208-20121228/66950_1 /TAXON_ID=197538 /ORGANISM="Strombidium inclinatum, Strain S3" /LENGTH=115 /DNA_ID=CAMNT_0010796269 /DNA_START=935 /DNA_END=1282 /DNA_ORIENTATION=-
MPVINPPTSLSKSSEEVNSDDSSSSTIFHFEESKLDNLIDDEVYNYEVDSDDEIDSYWVIGMAYRKKEDWEIRDQIMEVINTGYTEHMILSASIELQMKMFIAKQHFLKISHNLI